MGNVIIQDQWKNQEQNGRTSSGWTSHILGIRGWMRRAEEKEECMRLRRVGHGPERAVVPWMDEWMDGWMDEFMGGWMDGWMNNQVIRWPLNFRYLSST
jgi:hypothetical protein